MPDIHHLNLGGRAGQKRLGDDHTIPLCPYHHRGIEPPPVDVGPSLARASKAFREVFGSDADLLAEVNRLIGEESA